MAIADIDRGPDRVEVDSGGETRGAAQVGIWAAGHVRPAAQRPAGAAPRVSPPRSNVTNTSSDIHQDSGRLARIVAPGERSVPVT